MVPRLARTARLARPAFWPSPRDALNCNAVTAVSLLPFARDLGGRTYGAGWPLILRQRLTEVMPSAPVSVFRTQALSPFTAITA